MDRSRVVSAEATLPTLIPEPYPSQPSTSGTGVTVKSRGVAFEVRDGSLSN
jgi:hypothetical protein